MKEILIKLANVLTAQGRAHIKEKNFAIPEKEKYPIHDSVHARAALQMVAKHGTPAEQAKVRSAVHEKYPEMGKEAAEKKYDEKAAMTGFGLGAVAPMITGVALTPALVHATKANRNQPHITEDMKKQVKGLKAHMKVKGMTDVHANTDMAVRGGGGVAGPSEAFGKAPGPKPYQAHFTTAGKGGKLSNFEMNVLGHELGHTKNMNAMGKNLTKAYGATRMLSAATRIPTIGLAAYVGGKDNATAGEKATAGLMAAPSLIQLGEEAAATTRGLKGVAKYHGGGMKGLGKALFSGKAGGIRAHGMSMLSYGTVAAAPALAYLAASKIKEKNKLKKTAESKAMGRTTEKSSATATPGNLNSTASAPMPIGSANVFHNGGIVAVPR